MNGSRVGHRSTAALVSALAVVASLLVGVAPAAARHTECADHEGGVASSALVPDPFVAGPISGGARTGQPYGTTLVPLPDGWVEEEFFFFGTARALENDMTLGVPGATLATSAPYKTRIVVRRPTDPREFNGTVVFDWNNVTVPDDTDVNWITTHRTLMARGYAYVGVAAQFLGVEASPTALKLWDPVRYGSLSHPGDQFSYDIYSQAAEAVLDPIVLDGLLPCVRSRLAVGASQSGIRLNTYINRVHEQALVFDGFLPQLASPETIRRDVAPVLWLNTQAEIGATSVAEDSELFRLWEIAGPAHTTQEYRSYTQGEILYAHSNGQVNNYNDDEMNTWGFRSTPGSCITFNWFQVKHAFGAALVALDSWVRTGDAPEPMPRAERDASGRRYDEHGNLRGGVRSPILDAPIATYFAGGHPPGTDPCGLVGGNLPLNGLTRLFDAAKLASLYASGADYAARFTAAADEAVEAGMLLPESRDHLLRYLPQAAAYVDRAVAATS